MLLPPFLEREQRRNHLLNPALSVITQLVRGDPRVEFSACLPLAWGYFTPVFSHSTKPAPPSLRHAGGSGQLCPFPAPRWSVPTSTPKPRAEGSSPSAPAKKPAETLRFCRFSFSMCCTVMWFTLVQTPGFRTWFYPFPTVPVPSSTQSAPGFAFFARTGCVFLFFAVFWLQNFRADFCASCRIAFTS